MSVRAAVALTAWSYSRYDTWLLCPFKFKCKFIDKLPDPGSAAMDRGDRVHKGLAAYIMGQGTLPSEVKFPFQQQLYAELRAIPDTDKVVEQQWAFDRNWNPVGWFDRVAWFRSVLDAGVVYEDLAVEACDHKTGKRHEGSNDEQMETQAIAVFAQFKPAVHVTTRLIYIDAGSEEIAEFPLSDKDKLMAKWAGKVAPMFADTTFIPRPNDRCRFCVYSRSAGGPCRFG